MKRLTPLIIAFLMLISLGSTNSMAQGIEYRIVFAISADQEQRICSIRPDGTGFLTILDCRGKGKIGSIACSPDGSKIIFVSDIKGNYDLFIMNWDGSAVEQLTFTEEPEYSPSFSNDGRSIVYDRTHNGNRRIFEFDLETRAESCLIPDGPGGVSPACSPDGAFIAFHSDRSGSANQIFVMNRDGSNITQVSEDPRVEQFWNPCWSPDGRKIACAANGGQGGNYSIAIIDFLSKEIKYIAPNKVFLSGPSWSPDGNKIAFSGERDGSWDVFTVSVDGENVRQLTDRSSLIINPCWMVLSAEQCAALDSSLSKQPDFRNIKWGMTREQVQAAEMNAKFVDEYKGNLIYSTTLNELACNLYYLFNRDILMTAAYIVDESFSDSNRYLEEYYELRGLLEKKYGLPSAVIVDWENEQYKSNSSLWGRAVSLGHLVLRSEWLTDNTKIVLTLYGESYDITLMVGYYSIEQWLQAEQLHEEETLRDL